MLEELQEVLVRSHELGEIGEHLKYTDTKGESVTIVAIFSDKVFGYIVNEGKREYFFLPKNDEGVFHIGETEYHLKEFIDSRTHWGKKFKNLWGDPSK